MLDSRCIIRAKQKYCVGGRAFDCGRTSQQSCVVSLCVVMVMIIEIDGRDRAKLVAVVAMVAGKVTPLREALGEAETR